jgi:hypothetical protein
MNYQFEQRPTNVTTSDAIIKALENAPALIVPLVHEVPQAVLKRRPLPGKWSAHEHACHLSVVHALFFERLTLMLSRQHPHITPYLPDKDDADDVLLQLDLNESLEQFTRDRERLVHQLKELSAADWQRTAEHEEYAHYSVLIMFRHLAMHDMLHAYRIEELLLKKDW